MKNSEIRGSIKKDLPVEVNSSMIQKCVSSLPEVARRNSVIPLLQLQIFYFPKWLHVVSGLAFLLLLFMREQMTVFQMICYAGQMMYGAAALLGIHVILAGRSSMFELECTCKYQYSQIYLARLILAVCYLFLFHLGLNVIFILQFGRTKMIWNVLVLLPLVSGAFCTLILTRVFKMKSDSISLVMLLVSALMVQLLLQKILNKVYHFELAVIALFGMLLLFVLVQGWCLIGRRLTYAAYNM